MTQTYHNTPSYATLLFILMMSGLTSMICNLNNDLLGPWFFCIHMSFDGRDQL